MSKITFRADDELIDELETFDASKSEVMREALRQYLAQHPDAGIDQADDRDARPDGAESVDALIEERIDALVEERIDALTDDRRGRGVADPGRPQDVNVTVTLEGERVTADDSSAAADVRTGSTTTDAAPADEADAERKTCPQCGEEIGAEHVYCPNCGEKASHRIFCECGDEIRSDWSFCPSCGRRTPAADVLDTS